jgi:hypothetical protein
VAGLLAAWVFHDRAVVVRLPYYRNRLTGDSNYVVFNPFRDRSPEKAAADYLNAMRRGNCSEAAKRTVNLKLPNGFSCEQMLHEYNEHWDLFVQHLRNRRDLGPDVLLYYSNTGYEFTSVAVRRFGNEWRIVDFSKIW